MPRPRLPLPLPPARALSSTAFLPPSSSSPGSSLDALLSHRTPPPPPLRLPSLLSLPRPITPAYVLHSAALTLSALPPRMAARIRALESLPYIVGVNPFVSRLYAIYRESLESLVAERPVTSLAENEAFVRRLQGLVESHANDIPIMAKGFQECKRYMSPEKISAFLDSAIRSRIGTRLIGEQHVAVSRSLAHPMPGQVGVVQTDCSPREMVRHCAAFVGELCESTLGVAPELVLDGQVDATFAYIPVHLEYILTELLKNAYRATAEHFLLTQSSRRPTSTSTTFPSSRTSSSARHPAPPPITLTLSRTPAFLSIRIRDRGGGIAPAHLGQIFSYAFTTAGGDGDGDGDGGGPYALQQVAGGAGMDVIAGAGAGAGAGVGGHAHAHARTGTATRARTGKEDLTAGDGGANGPGRSAGPGGGGAAADAGGAGVFAELTGSALRSGMGTIAGLGYGLPLAKLYATYFGGNLDLVSLYGHGTDVFVKLRSLDAGADVEL